MSSNSAQWGLTYPLGPQIPTGYCNPPTNLAVSVNGDIITFSWTKPHDVLYYVLTITQNSTPVAYSLTGQILTVRVAANTDGFTWTVKAVCSVSSDSILVDGPGFNSGDYVPACIPVNMSLTTIVPTAAGMAISWPADADAIAYKIYYKQHNLVLPPDVVSTNTNSIVIANLNPGVIYDLWIVKILTNGMECKSDVVSFTTPVSNCPIPVVKTIINGNTGVIVWSAPGATEFDIYVNSMLVASNYPGNIFTLYALAWSTTFNIVVISKCGSGSSIAGTGQIITGTQPCAPVTGFALQGIVGTTATVIWDAVAGTGYNLVINGSLVVINNPLTTSYSFTVVPGGAYRLRLQSLCDTSIVSLNFMIVKFVVDFECKAVPVSTLTIQTTATTAYIDWPDIPGVTNYEYRYKRVADGPGSWSAWISLTVPPSTTPNSNISLSGLILSTAYDLEIRSTCVDGDTAVLATTFNTSARLTGQTPVITLINDITVSQGRVYFELPDGKLQGDFRLRLTKVSDSSQLTFTGERTSILGSGLEPNTAYTAAVSEILADYTQVWSTEVAFTTCRTPVEASFTVAFNDDGETIITIAALPSGASGFKVSRMPSALLSSGNDPEWETIYEGTDLVTTYTTKPWEYAFYKVEVLYTNCAGSEKIKAVGCPVVKGLVARVEGNKVTLSWDAIPGVFKYKVHLVSLQEGLEQYYTSTPSVIIGNLLSNTLYSWSVFAQCETEEWGGESDAATFTTQDASTDDNGCEPPIFGAIAQPSSLIDMEDEGVEADNSDPATLHYNTIFGDGFDRSMTFKNGQGDPIDITGYGFQMNVRNMVGDLLLTFTHLDGSVFVGGTNGTITLFKEGPDMEVLTVGIYTFDLKWTTTDDIIKTMLTGTITVKPLE